MASQLLHVNRTLTWSDFGRPRAGDDPAPGTTATAAQMRVTHRHTLNGESVPGSHPNRVRLKNDVVVDVTLQSAQIFVNAWVLRQPQAFQDAVLHHEQGHYDMVALFCRDMFAEFMVLKTQDFATGPELIRAMEAILNSHDALIAGVHESYDNNTAHGRDSARQAFWDRMIQTAFTTNRTPQVDGNDGQPLKVRLDGVLRSGGISL